MMAGTRKYKLLCPIARALDRVGDRWTLLILRDLHAGPARFGELQTGLTGIAANLLTDRLSQLVADGLIEKYQGAHGITLYALTELGASTGNIIFELAQFGGRFSADDEPITPGNLRTVATTLALMCHRVASDQLSLAFGFDVDGERFAIEVQNGTVNSRYKPDEMPNLILGTSYTALLDVFEGDMNLEEFGSKHLRLSGGTDSERGEVMQLLEKSVELMQAAVAD
jgi:DNA-binding HxlR family transcriptional regulator/putative sterol carrier protein